jgi:hypothetical protein
MHAPLAFFLMSLLAKLFLLSINFIQSCCSLQSPLFVFFLIALARQYLFRPKENVCLFRPEEDDVISVISSTQSASLVISNLVSLHKPIYWFRFRINITGMQTLRSRRYSRQLDCVIAFNISSIYKTSTLGICYDPGATLSALKYSRLGTLKATRSLIASTTAFVGHTITQ